MITPSGMHTLFTHMLEFQIFETSNILVAVMFQNCFGKFFTCSVDEFLNFLAADACMQWFSWSGKFLTHPTHPVLLPNPAVVTAGIR